MRSIFLKCLLMVTAVITLASTSSAQVVLLAGFDGNQTEAAGPPKTLTAPLQDASAVGNVTVALSTTDTIIGFDWAAGFQSNSAIWGSASTFTPAADTTNNNAVYAHDPLATITMTISNTGTGDLTLDSLMMRVKRDNSTTSATGIRLTYASGDLSDTAGANSLFALSGAASTVGYDFALGGFMTDLTLAAGEDAIFTWASEGGSGGRTRFDNIALSGTVIPEPSSFALILIGLGSLVALRRRR